MGDTAGETYHRSALGPNLFIKGQGKQNGPRIRDSGQIEEQNFGWFLRQRVDRGFV